MVARNEGSRSAEKTALTNTPTHICGRVAPPLSIQKRIYTIPRAEQPSPIIINSLLSYLSARTPAGTLKTRVGRKPRRVTMAIFAALPVCLKI